MEIEKFSDTPEENRTPSASVSPDSTLTATPTEDIKQMPTYLEDLYPLRPQSLHIGSQNVILSTPSKCDKEQQTPQETNPPFIIPPPMLPQEMFDSSSEPDFKVCDGLFSSTYPLIFTLT